MMQLYERTRQRLYQDHLADILRFSGGRRLLSTREVGKYTGLRDPRTIRTRFPYFRGSYLSAAILARCLSGDLEAAEQEAAAEAEREEGAHVPV